MEKAQPEFDAAGHPVLRSPGDRDTARLGITLGNLQSEDAPVELRKGLMEARLKQTLAKSRAPRISGSELREDWLLLEKIDDAGQDKLTKKLAQGSQLTSQ